MNTILKANNLSGGIWDNLLEMLKEHGIGKSCCLVAEDPCVEPLFRNWFPKVEFGYVGVSNMEYELDLNIPIEIEKQYDSVFSQALIEHVCNPFMAIQNMASLCNTGGIIVIHTVSLRFGIHRFPVDCVRFLPDFWTEMCKYVDIELIDYQMFKQHVFVTYKKT